MIRKDRGNRQRPRTAICVTGVGALLLAACGLGAGTAFANLPPTVSLHVTTTTDIPTCAPGICSLRGAINVADAAAAGAVVSITVPAGHYVLTQGVLATTNAGVVVQIYGANSANTVVDGSGNSGNASVFDIGGPTQMSGLTVTGGTGQFYNGSFGGTNCVTVRCGGGIYVTASLTMSNTTVTGNTVGTAGSGGGIYIAPWYVPIHLSNVQVTYNSAGDKGGGIYSHADTVVLDAMNVSHNTVCGTLAVPTASPLSLSNACIGGGSGGGIYSDEIMTLNGGSVTYNTAGGLSVDNGYGGGIYNDWRVSLNNVTVTHNVAGRQGGGYYNSDAGVMNGGTLSSNMAGEKGGGWGYDGDHSIFVNVVISNNSAGGRFACIVTTNNASVPTSASCTNLTGTLAVPTTSTCSPANSATFYCSAKNGVGGGIDSEDDVNTLGGSIVGNYAVSVGISAAPCQSLGGGIYESDGTHLDGTMVKNNAASCGGGVYADNAPLQTNGTHFFTNHALRNGGAIYGSTSKQSLILLDNTIVVGNVADSVTGGVYTQQSGTMMTQGATVVSGNTAPSPCPNTKFPCT